jgi:putative membrane protein
MYYWPNWCYFGIHLLWWLCWALRIVSIVAMTLPVRRKRWLRDNDPLTILQRRYAAGGLTTAEYEERKQRLERDRRPAPHSTTAKHPDEHAEHAT